MSFWIDFLSVFTDGVLWGGVTVFLIMILFIVLIVYSVFWLLDKFSGGL